MKKLLLCFFLLNAVCLIAQNVVENGPYVCPPCDQACDKLTFDQAGKCSHCGMELMPASERKMPTNTSKKKIAFYLQSGVEILDFAGPMEVFSYAGFEVFTVSKTKDPIISQGILHILPDYSVENAPAADILAFFGGNGLNAARDTVVTNWVKAQKEVEYYFSVCTGALILAESGLLDNQTATTFHSTIDFLAENYPKTKVLANTRFVDNGRIITTAGISAGIDGALHMVAKLKGFNAAREVAYHMEYDKWVPGEGLILTEENPYEGFTNTAQLEEYVGLYTFKNNTTMRITLNLRERSLTALIDDRSYPLFYEAKDQFSNLNGAMINFHRDAQGQVKNYQRSDVKGQTFAKLEE